MDAYPVTTRWTPAPSVARTLFDSTSAAPVRLGSRASATNPRRASFTPGAG